MYILSKGATLWSLGNMSMWLLFKWIYCRKKNERLQNKKKKSYDECTLVVDHQKYAETSLWSEWHNKISKHKTKIKHENNLSLSSSQIPVYWSIVTFLLPRIPLFIWMTPVKSASYIKMNQRSIKLAMFSEMSTKESLWGFIQLTAWLSVISWQVKNILEIDIKTPNKNY